MGISAVHVTRGDLYVGHDPFGAFAKVSGTGEFVFEANGFIPEFRDLSRIFQLADVFAGDGEDDATAVQLGPGRGFGAQFEPLGGRRFS